MFLRLLALFILIPIIELAILIKVGSMIGFWPTMSVVVITGIVGAALARYQGFMILEKIRSEVNFGRVPAEKLLDGLLVLIGGIVLLTPGFLTDLFGFLLLIPFTRVGIKSLLRKKLEQKIAKSKTQTTIIVE